MATAILSGDNNYFTFLCFNDTSGGFLYTTPAPELEELRTPGVDGKRHRTLSYQFGVVTVQTLADCATFSAGITLGNSYRSAVGSFLQLSVSVGAGQNLIFKNVYVSGVSPTPRIGQAIGLDASSGNLAHVIANWNLELTEFAESATA